MVEPDFDFLELNYLQKSLIRGQKNLPSIKWMKKKIKKMAKKKLTQKLDLIDGEKG